MHLICASWLSIGLFFNTNPICLDNNYQFDYFVNHWLLKYLKNQLLSDKIHFI